MALRRALTSLSTAVEDLVFWALHTAQVIQIPDSRRRAVLAPSSDIRVVVSRADTCRGVGIADVGFGARLDFVDGRGGTVDCLLLTTEGVDGGLG